MKDSSADAFKRVFVAGHRGMVGSALCRKLALNTKIELVTRSRDELNLLNQKDVFDFFKNNQVDEIYLAAAKVGGIHSNNTYPAEFIYQNLTIQGNIIEAAHLAGIQKILFLGSSCIYPKLAKQPIHESELLTGLLEPTNEPYAMAKIAGIKMCEAYNRQYGRDYRSVMPTNLYGPGDNFHPENSHVIPGMINRFEFAKKQNKKTITIWGTGSPRREFLHVDDMADACIHVMNLSANAHQMVVRPDLSHLNVGTGIDCSIKDLAELLCQITGFSGKLDFDTSKPDGTPRKLLDVGLLQKTGWRSRISLEDGLQHTWQWFQERGVNDKSIRKS